jgi:para-nitrobenzyl esterase
MGSGATGLYAGRHLAERGDVVVVTLNYRLGALGFLDLKAVGGGADAPSNLGLRDQVAALAWVRDHLEAFGGDPGRVTIFGESAGGMSVGTLLATPSARGLFQRAILQSGAAHNVSSREQARRVAENFLAKLRIDPDHPERLWSRDAQEILGAQRATTYELGLALGTLPWQPSVDGDVLPRAPLQALADGEAARVATLVGSNLDEWNLFMLGDRRGRSMDEAGLRRRLARALPGRTAQGAPLADRAHAAYRRSLRRGDSTAPRERWVSFQSDRIFHVPAVRVADLQSDAGAPTWSYLFSWAPPLVSRWVGACHGLEIPFVFGTLGQGTLLPSIGASRGARGLSRRIQDAWLGFARGGEPGHEGLPDWPKADSRTRPTLSFDRHCRVLENPHARGVEFWRELL